MTYDEEQEKTQRPDKAVLLIRKALAPLIEKGLNDELFDNLTSGEQVRVTNSEVAQKLAEVAKSVQELGEVQITTDVGTLHKSMSSIEELLGTGVIASDQTLLYIRKLYAEALKKSTNPEDPRDYINVRLTDGKDFYNAVRRMSTAIESGGTLPFANPDGSAARVQLTSTGKVPVDATVNNQITVAVSGIDTIAGHVSIDGGIVGSVALMSGVSVIPPIQQNVSVSGTVNVLDPHLTDGTAQTQIVSTSGVTLTQSLLSTDNGNGAIDINGIESHSFSITANQVIGPFDVSKYSWVAVSLSSRGTTATTTFQSSLDGVNFNATGMALAGNGALLSSSTGAAPQLWQGPLAGKFFQLSITGMAGGFHAGVITFFTNPRQMTQTQTNVVGATGTGTALTGAPVRIGASDRVNARDLVSDSGGVLYTQISGMASPVGFLPMLPNGANIIGQVVVASGVVATAVSGTHNAHIDNWPTVQHVFVENQPVSQTISGTVGGTVNAVVQNFNPLQESFIKGGQVTLASGITVNTVANTVIETGSVALLSGVTQGSTPWTTSGTMGGTVRALVDNLPVNQTVNGTVALASGVAITSALAASGVQNVHVDNYPTYQSVIIRDSGGASLDAGGRLKTALYADSTTNVTQATDMNSDGRSGSIFAMTVANLPFLFNGTSFDRQRGQNGIPTVVIASGNNLSISNTVATSGTVGGSVQAVVSNFPTSQTVNGTVALASGVAITSVLSASGVQNVHIDNYPSVQGVFVNNALNVATLPAVTAVSGTLNAHIDNFPLVQSVQVQGTASVSGTVGGTVQAVISNLPAEQTVRGTVALASGVVATAVSGTLNAHVDNWPSVQHAFIENPVTSVSVNNTVSTSGTVGGAVQAVVQNYPGSLPLGANLIGAVVLASGVTVAPNTGLTDVSIRGGSVALLSGISITPPIQQNVSVSGVYGEVLARVVNPVTIASGVAISSVLAASGVQNVHIDNYPSTQGVFVNNSLNVASLPAVTSVSGTLNAHIDNWPSTQHVFVDNASTFPTRTLVSGTDIVNIGNFPTGITTVVQNIVSVSGTIANAAGNTLAVSGTINGNVTVVSTSGTQNVHVDNWPSVQHSFIENSLNVASIPAVTATSGTLNSHIDNWPSVQHVFIENPVTSVSTSGTVGGTVNAVVQNFNPLQEVFNKGGQVTVLSGVAVSSVLAASGVQNVHVDNYPAVQAVSQNGLPGNWTINNAQVGGTNVDTNAGNASAGTQRVVIASDQPKVTVSGSSPQANYNVNTTPIKTIYGSVASLGVNTLLSGITGQFIKVQAYSLLTQSTTAVTPSFIDDNAVGLWQPGPMQAITGTSFGANLSTDAPSYLFKTSATGLGLKLNLSSAQTVFYSISYWADGLV